MGTTRDYYADLELPATADVQEIKKQFRKLALKYHPDRNPGREEEVNSKFQIIQAAHEILIDPQQKAKYDATLGRSFRYPTSSGVKGNPWQNVSQQFPTPPRRNPQPRNPTTGAQRWHERFSSGVPPTAKQPTASDSTAKASAARAFANMRKGPPPGGNGQNAPRQSAPPPPPPRTETAKKRAEASFGTRKTGFHPRSAMPGDEPPVSNNNYSSRPNEERFQTAYSTEHQPTIPDPLAQFRQRDTESYMDPRQSTPYSTHGGEKTNPFDGIPLNRARSAREPARPDDSSESEDDFSPKPRHRSSSVPRNAKKQETGQNFRDDGRPIATPRSSFKSRAGSKFNSGNAFETPRAESNTAAQASQDSNASYPSQKRDNKAKAEPSMYEQFLRSQRPLLSIHYTSAYFPNPTYPKKSSQVVEQQEGATEFHNYESDINRSPSGNHDAHVNLTPYERRQHLLLNHLITNRGTEAALAAGLGSKTVKNHKRKADLADTSFFTSFNFNVDDDAFVRTSPETRHFGKSNVDGINTNFTPEGSPAAWNFSAGGNEQSHPDSRSQSGSRFEPSSPTKRPTTQRTDSSDPPVPSAQQSSGFNAEGWNNQFGPGHFVPNQAVNAPISPTRSGRINSKKTKTPKQAAGTAGVEDGFSSDEDNYDWRGRNAHTTKVPTTDSPQAMDIDSPPATEEVPSIPLRTSVSPSESRSASARNIPVEPSRPEWRPGNFDSVETNPNQAQDVAHPPAAAVGSEDSEEFRANFSDLKNVAPFAEQKDGLTSFDDLKDNLPFESKASREIPIEIPPAHPLALPNPPVAPRLPPTVAIDGMKPNISSWSKYLEEFESYLRLWDAFNCQVIDHFTARNSLISRARASKGYAFLGARGDGDVKEYHNWALQDNDVRRRWQIACEEHERRFREFMAFRDRMR